MSLNDHNFQHVLYVQRDEHMTESFQAWEFRNLLPEEQQNKHKDILALNSKSKKISRLRLVILFENCQNIFYHTVIDFLLIQRRKFNNIENSINSPNNIRVRRP